MTQRVLTTFNFEPPLPLSRIYIILFFFFFLIPYALGAGGREREAGLKIECSSAAMRHPELLIFRIMYCSKDQYTCTDKQ